MFKKPNSRDHRRLAVSSSPGSQFEDSKTWTQEAWTTMLARVSDAAKYVVPNPVVFLHH